MNLKQIIREEVKRQLNENSTDRVVFEYWDLVGIKRNGKMPPMIGRPDPDQFGRIAENPGKNPKDILVRLQNGQKERIPYENLILIKRALQS